MRARNDACTNWRKWWEMMHAQILWKETVIIYVRKGKKRDEFFRVNCSFSLSRIQRKLNGVQPLLSRDLVWFFSIKHAETRSTKTSNKHTLILSVEERRKKTTVEHQKIEPCRRSCLVKFKGNWASYLNNLKSVRKFSNEFACLQRLHWIDQFKCGRRSNIYGGL